MRNIKSAKLVDVEDLVVTAELAIVSAEGNDESGSASGAAEKHIVALHARQANADAMPVAPMGYAEIKAMVEDAGGEMAIDGVELEEPVAVSKASTRAFMHKGTANVVANFRYEF